MYNAGELVRMMVHSVGELVGIRLYSVGELVDQTKIYYTHTQKHLKIFFNWKQKKIVLFFIFPPHSSSFYFGLFQTSFDDLDLSFFSLSLLFRLWMLMYAYKESPFPWRDSLLQPQFVSQLRVVVGSTFGPRVCWWLQVNMLVYFCLFRHWLFKYVCKESVSFHGKTRYCSHSLWVGSA